MDAVVELIQALSSAAWPAIVLYVIWSYRRQVADLIDSAKSRKFTIEVGGQKLSMEEANQQQQGLIADLQKQLLELRERVEGFKVSPTATLTEAPEARGATVSNAPSNLILWVDDNPKNNSYFIDLLQRRGYRVDIALSTEDALANLSRNSYRLILSDMGRTEAGRYKPDAGIDLLKQIQERHIETPYVVYSGQQGVDEFRRPLETLGGRAITASPTELRAILDELAPG